MDETDALMAEWTADDLGRVLDDLWSRALAAKGLDEDAYIRAKTSALRKARAQLSRLNGFGEGQDVRVVRPSGGPAGIKPPSGPETGKPPSGPR